MMFYQVMAIYTAACFSVWNNLLLNHFFVLSVVFFPWVFLLCWFVFLPHFPYFCGGFYTLPASFWFKIFSPPRRCPEGLSEILTFFLYIFFLSLTQKAKRGRFYYKALTAYIKEELESCFPWFHTIKCWKLSPKCYPPNNFFFPGS